MEFLHGSTPPIIHRDLKSPKYVLFIYLLPFNDFFCTAFYWQHWTHEHQLLQKWPISELVGWSILLWLLWKIQVLISIPCIIMLILKLVWLAPEVMRKQPFTLQSDVYSFGVILWELLTRQKYFGEITFASLIEDTIKSGGRPKIPESCCPSYAKLIQDCWDDGNINDSLYYLNCSCSISVRSKCPPFI
jgi:serine/threonine protein kinase